MTPRALVLSLVAAAVLVPGPAAATSRADRELIRSLDAEVKALKQKLELYEEQGGGALAGPDPVYPELVQIFAGQPVEVSRRGPRTFVTFPASLLFATDDVRLREEGQMALDLFSTVVNARRGYGLVVTGHTHSEPPAASIRKRFPTNLEFSAARATAVAMELVNRYGVTPTRITVAGRGEADPVANNDTPEERAQNERVVVELVAGGAR